MTTKARAGSPRLKGTLSCSQEQGQCLEDARGMLRDTVLSLAGWCPPSLLLPLPSDQDTAGFVVSLEGDTQVAGVSVQAVLCRSSCLVAPGGQGGGGSEARRQASLPPQHVNQRNTTPPPCFHLPQAQAVRRGLQASCQVGPSLRW